MSKFNFPEDLEALKKKVLDALSPIKEADENTKANKNFLFSAQRTNAGRSLPPYQLVYFLLYDLLGFRDLGRSEKVAWSIPIDFNGKAFLIEHRKLGVGVFASNLEQDEADAQQIVKRIHKAVKMAAPYFEWLASEAVSKSKLNVINESGELYNRYEYFLGLYREENKQANERKNEVCKKTTKTKYGTVTSYRIPYYELEKNANWLAIAAIDAFFSWTEHLFIHLAVVAKRVSTGEEIADLTGAGWQEKFKSAISLEDTDAEKYYDELILVRRQLRNFIAHGAFGKKGETFLFHSGAGAVPVLMPHQKGKNRFALSSELAFDEDSVLELLDNFISYLWSSDLSPAMYYVQESGLPTILTMAKDGTYSKAMRSREDMEEFVKYLSYQFDQAANMDW